MASARNFGGKERGKFKDEARLAYETSRQLSNTHKHVFQCPFGQPAVEEDGNEQMTPWRVAHLRTLHARRIHKTIQVARGKVLVHI